MLRVLERACSGEPVRVLVSTPPQHGKSQTVEHAIARDLLLNPGKFWAYVTYSSDKARIESRQIRDFSIRAGVELRPDTRALGYWRTPQGGGLLATGIGGPITGQRSLKRIIVDDPIKGSEDAESPLIRDNTYDWFQSSIISRAHPDTAIMVIATRWHHDDLIGRLAQQTNSGAPMWEVINLPAIGDYGDALWPERRPIEFLERQRAGMTSYFWNALFMGRPVPRGETVFGDATNYVDVPASAYRVGGGLDLAYTEKTRSDYSVAVVMARVLSPKPDEDLYYVLDVRRAQRAPPEFHEEAIEPIKDTYPGIRFRCYLATSEMGSGQFMRKLGTNVDLHRAKVDKFQRAQPVAAAWQAGRVLVPSAAPWRAAFLDEVQKFTGVGDRHDDQVDALAAAYDLLAAHKPAGRVPAPHRRESFDNRAVGA
jgi:predicted phage terminase large subunit-like protein